MTHRSMFGALVAAYAFTCGVGSIYGNGIEFFPATTGPVDLVYFGTLKDARTGQPVRDHAYVTVTDTLTGMSVPFTGDKPGHYRSPDIGAAIKELGEVARPEHIEMTLVVPGYKKIKIDRMPRKAAGAVEVSFKLERDGSALAATTASGAAPATVDRRPLGLFVMIGFTLLLGAVAFAARVMIGRADPEA
jgi:hypothetical protein